MKKALILLIPLLFGQGVGDGVNPDKGNFAWDAPVTREDGSALTVAEIGYYEIAISTTAQDMNADGVAMKIVRVDDCTAASCTESMAELCTGILEGTYNFWIRAVDKAENKSAWSAPWVDTIYRSPPAPPLNFQCEKGESP